MLEIDSLRLTKRVDFPLLTSRTIGDVVKIVMVASVLLFMGCAAHQHGLKLSTAGRNDTADENYAIAREVVDGASQCLNTKATCKLMVKGPAVDTSNEHLRKCLRNGVQENLIESVNAAYIIDERSDGLEVSLKSIDSCPGILLSFKQNDGMVPDTVYLGFVAF